MRLSGLRPPVPHEPVKSEVLNYRRERPGSALAGEMCRNRDISRGHSCAIIVAFAMPRNIATQGLLRHPQERRGRALPKFHRNCLSRGQVVAYTFFVG
jgi:hypothetical protein